MVAIDELLARNAAYAKGFSLPDGAAAPPRLRVAVVTCMDARIDVFRALGLEPGDAHVLRNAGGLVTDDVLRSLVLSQRLLGTAEVMVIQHTRCGVQGLDEEELDRQVIAEAADHEVPPFRYGSFDDLDASVRASLGRISTCPWLKVTHRARGFVYDIDTAHLREVV
jgi:carbonic anhydrase